MKILVLSSIYPAEDLPKTFTPVVHYFAKEWLLQGHEVFVFNSFSSFPKIFYFGAKLFSKILTSFFGFAIPTQKPKDISYNFEGVDVVRKSISKIKPHSRFPKKKILAQVDNIVKECKKRNFTPDVIVGHWMNPQFDLLIELKQIFPNAKTALTLHDGEVEFMNLFPDFAQKLTHLDKLGFRNHRQQERFIKATGLDIAKTYLCLSGIPDSFLEGACEHKFSDEVKNFIFVGALIKRKYPSLLVSAINKVLSGKDFSIKFVGSGAEESVIKKLSEDLKIVDKVQMLGRIERQKIKSLMANSDCLIMISKFEVYGLVYLEAMALGCIPIASKDEGFDGIIVDGYNGFLCRAGDEEDLSRIIARIRNLPKDELVKISTNAINTAYSMTDSLCAKQYLQSIS